jgi:Putative esterase
LNSGFVTKRTRRLCASALAPIIVGALLAMIPGFSRSASAATTGVVSDAFARGDGVLGAGWAAMVDGGLAISSQEVVGTNSSYSGDIRIGETYSSDQSSQIAVSSTQLSGGEWVGPAVRAQNNGANTYLGLYFWNNNNPELMLFKRINMSWTQLGAAPTAALAAGTQLTLSAAGSTITFSENGSPVITVTDTSLTGGNPGIMAYGTPRADDWTGTGATGPAPSYTIGGTVSGLTGPVTLQNNGADPITVTANGPFSFDIPAGAYNVTVATNPTGQTCTITNGTGTATTPITNITITCTSSARIQVTFEGTANGIDDYSTVSADDGGTAETLQVLEPTHPAAGVEHNFLFVLPVEPGVGSTYGDGIDTLASLDAEDQYNLTIVEPSFPIDPWYANSSTNAEVQFETFMTTDLVPWVEANLSKTGTEQNWLIGFSKSGIGGQDLILKHPDVFSLAASWDFPADMSSYDQFGASSSNNYGTQQNFAENYQLTPAFVSAHSQGFTTSDRIWIGGYEAFQSDMVDYDALLTSEGIVHTLGAMQPIAHRWDSGWVPEALAALYSDSRSLSSSGS